MIIIIEKAKPGDLNSVISLLRELYLELGEEAESISFLDKNLILDIFHSGKTQIYLVKIDGQDTAGILTLTECQAIYAGGKYGLIDEMYIKPKYRSNKIGAALVEKAKSIGIENNWKRIDVTAPTEERWKRTVHFYEKCGFVFTGPKLKMKLP